MSYAFATDPRASNSQGTTSCNRRSCAARLAHAERACVAITNRVRPSLFNSGPKVLQGFRFNVWPETVRTINDQNRYTPVSKGT